MNRGLRIALVTLVCTPMVLSLVLLLMVSWSGMDGLTQKMPLGVKTLVVDGIVRLGTRPNMAAQSDMAAQRARKLDLPETQRVLAEMKEERLARRRLAAGSAPKPNSEMTAVYEQQRSVKNTAKVLSDDADIDMKKGKVCDAEKLYTAASNMDQGEEVYRHLDGAGRAGVRCGNLQSARENLETVIGKEDNFLKGTEEDQLTDMRSARLRDLQFLSIAYERLHEPKLQAAVCTRIDSHWVSCSCEVAGDGAKCSGKTR